MLRLSIRRLLTARGIEQQHRFLQKIGISAHAASNLLTHQFTYIKSEHVHKICMALNCTPSELFTYFEDPADPLPPNHALQKLKDRPAQAIASRIRTLHPDQLEKLNQYLSEIEKETT